MKCALCGKKVEETFLKKIVGTYVKDARGKKHGICVICQRAAPSKEALLKQLR